MRTVAFLLLFLLPGAFDVPAQERTPARPASGQGSIVTPPFFAVEMSPLTRKSMGGVAIDMECRALDSAHQSIPGLYAVGEVAGVRRPECAGPE